MGRALIGHTGFVGSNLRAQESFSELYNSRNFQEMAGRSFDEVWCAGVPAVKWWANQNPEADKAGIEALAKVLQTVTTRTFVLMSTIDVYKTPLAVDETTPVETSGLHPYGCHRYQFECFVRKRFERALVVRLPGLYGVGLKKNAIYDLLHNNQLEKIHPDSVFQFYGVDRLVSDTNRALDAGLSLVNFGTEPLSISVIAESIFGIRLNRPFVAEVPRYDMQTLHASLYGRMGRYIQSAAEVLHRIRNFADAMRNSKPR